MYDLDQVGTFSVTGALCVRDPARIPQAKIVELDNVVHGKWISAIRTINVGRWGPRVSMLVAWHEDAPINPDGTEQLEHIGDIHIDTGTCMITDSKSAAAAFPERDEYAKSIDDGVTCRSGWGDGVYDVYRRESEPGMTDAIVVVFIRDEELV